MRVIFSLIAIFAALNTFSQNAPDFDKIDYEITNPSSQYYYPNLMARYQRNDTTLTQDDYYHLYFGYPTQENYRPLAKTNYVDSLNMIFSSRRAATGDEFSKIERYCKAILSVEPFNLRDINMLAYSYQEIGYVDKAIEQMYKLNKIANVIKSTGNGLTEKTPWWVIYQEHAEDILNLMNAEPGRTLIMSKEVEFIACGKTPEKQIKGYYFNYSEVYKGNPDYLKELSKPKRKLDIKPKTNDKYELVK